MPVDTSCSRTTSQLLTHYYNKRMLLSDIGPTRSIVVDPVLLVEDSGDASRQTVNS